MTFKLFTQAFVAIPLATLISASRSPLPTDKLPATASKSLAQTAPIVDKETGHKRFFVVHGGLFSKDNVTLSDIRAVDRFAKKQPGQEGLMMELLWSDPQVALAAGLASVVLVSVLVLTLPVHGVSSTGSLPCCGVMKSARGVLLRNMRDCVAPCSQRPTTAILRAT